MIIEVSQPGEAPQASVSLMAIEQRVSPSCMEWVQVGFGFLDGCVADGLCFLDGFCCFGLILAKSQAKLISANGC